MESVAYVGMVVDLEIHHCVCPISPGTTLQRKSLLPNFACDRAVQVVP